MSSAANLDRFDQLELSAPLVQALTDLGYETPSPIQAQSIPTLLQGRDLLGQAQTGTGKTAAFALPALMQIDEKLRDPQVLVLTPTRELALQVSEAFSAYAKHLKGLQVLTLYGGQAMHVQLRALKRGPQIIVATPGRMLDHLRRGSLTLSRVKFFVLDEADEMLKMGFIDDVEAILEQAPPERQMALFSATMPAPIRQIARRHMHAAQEVKIGAKTATVEATDQRCWFTYGVRKQDAIVRILETEDYDAMLVFVRTRSATQELADHLVKEGYNAAALNGDMQQGLREATIAKLKKGALDILVATDVAARGLDVDRISHVLNYDIPYDAETYVHRIGRTGRAGRKGNATTFVEKREHHLLRTIERAIKCPIKPMELPDAATLRACRVKRFKQQLADTLTNPELDLYRTVIAEFCSENQVSENDAAAALGLLLQRDKPFQVAELVQRKPKPGSKHTRNANNGKFDERGKPKDKRKFRNRHDDTMPMVRYRLEVGRQHNAKPGDIVGAIANEAGVEGRHIGRIQLFDDYSTVDLPEMPKAKLQRLRSAWVRNRQLRISAFEQDQSPAHKAAA